MRRSLLIFAAVAVVVGGGLYFLVGVHLPGRARRAAQVEIEGWEERLDAARTCLVGTAPKSSNMAEALALEKLGERDFRRCSGAIGRLTRDGTEDTGIDDVETAWHAVDKAAVQVARTFADAINAAAYKSLLEPLGSALAKLDQAHQTVRRAAGMDPRPAPAGKPLPAAELIEMPIGSIEAWLRPSAGGLVALGSPAKSRVDTDPFTQLILVPGAAPKLVTFQTGVRPSFDDASWGAWAIEIPRGAATDYELAFGAIDAGGALKPTAKAPSPKRLHTEILFALGTAANGLAALSVDHRAVTIARVAGPTISVEPMRDVADFAFAIDPSAKRGLLVWSKEGKIEGGILRAGVPTRVVELGSGRAGQSCFTATRAWVSGGDGQFLELDDAGTTTIPHVLPKHDLVGCSATAVLLQNAGHRYSVCTTTCRVVELAAAPLAKPAIAGDQAIAVLVKDRIVAVWRERGEPLFFMLPAALHHPKFVHASATVVDVVGSVGDRYAIARVRL